jgi:Na+-transporting methylmalonyl-CoA/oxaloacetate decarboxylase gamma subunit
MWEVFEQAVAIAAVGVTLIFVVLAVMWGLMAALVRLTTPPSEVKTEEAATAPAERSAQSARHRAAAAAVAVALATAPPARENTPATLSPWQAVQRSRALNFRPFHRPPPTRP